MTHQPTLFQVSEITVSYRPKRGYSPQITTSEEAYEVFMDYWPKDTISYEERLVIMLLTKGQTILGIHTHSVGGISATMADIRQIFAIVLKANATGIIIAHNHPSGQLRPSQHDRTLTQKIKEAGTLLDVPLIDHLIITAHNGYYSFADEKTL